MSPGLSSRVASARGDARRRTVAAPGTNRQRGCLGATFTGFAARFRFGHLHVTKRDRQCVGGVSRLRRLAQSEQRANHLLYLLFSGMAVTCNAGFNLARGIAEAR